MGKTQNFIENIGIKSTQEYREELWVKNQELLQQKSYVKEYNSVQEKLDSIIFQISLKITEYLKLLKYKHGTSTTRFDLQKLTLITNDSNGKFIPMNRIGSGANHLALHISTLLAFHYYFQKFNCPIPSFIIFDQPSQVYFPKLGLESEKNLNNSDYYNLDDIEAVKNLFKFLIEFTKTEVIDFQIIVTEHAIFDENWFQDCMIEPFWYPYDALVPDDWPSKSDLYS